MVALGRAIAWSRILQAHLSLLPSQQNKRVDAVLSALFPRYSRACWQHWLQSGEARLDGAQVKNNYKVRGAERVCVDARLPEHLQAARVEHIPLTVVFEDQHLLVIDKPIGIAMHPGAGIYSGTVLNALLGRGAPFDKLPRAGIVHRLDKDTSGLVAIAKSLPAIHSLSTQLAERSMRRSYYAVCENVPIAGGSVDKVIARNRRNRLKMDCFEPDEAPANAKPALSKFRVERKFPAHALLEVQLASGRTHQIRVHMASIGYPLVGDKLYGWRKRLAPNLDPSQRAYLQNFPRQALHAHKLELQHPETNTPQQFTSPLPADIRRLLTILAAN